MPPCVLNKGRMTMKNLRNHYFLMIALGLAFAMPHENKAMNAQNVGTFLGAAVLLGYTGVWAYDGYRTLPKIWDSASKIKDPSKLYNWFSQKYSGDRPLEFSDRDTFIRTNILKNHDKNSVTPLDDLFKDLKIDWISGKFNSLNPNGERAESKRSDVSAEAPLDDSTFLKLVAERIKEEKKELEKYLDEINNYSKYCFGWSSARKTYKSVCKLHKFEPDQVQWTQKNYEDIEKDIKQSQRTGLLHWIYGKPTYGTIARLYGSFLTRYERLRKMERYVIDKRGRSVYSIQEYEEHRKLLREQNQEDISLSSWLWKKWRGQNQS